MIGSIEKVLSSVSVESCARLRAEGSAALCDGALLVDVRPLEQRSRGGEFPGAVVIDRNVFEWRLDPASPHRVPEIDGFNQMIIVVCNEGSASRLPPSRYGISGFVGRNATKPSIRSLSELPGVEPSGVCRGC